ncbi:MAG: chorion class high-cysteine HCB protein 13 [Christensenellaceae bacterium]|nr:chorion class high-cysteine HCB protein 13 [Christensenellaceae bacterium]
MGFFEEKGDCGCNHGCGFGGFGGNSCWLIFLLLICGGGCGGGCGHDRNMGCIDVCELLFIIFLLGICGRGCHKNC